MTLVRERVLEIVAWFFGNTLFTNTKVGERLAIVANAINLVLTTMQKIDVDEFVICILTNFAFTIFIVWLVYAKPDIDFPAKILAPKRGSRRRQVNRHVCV